MSRRWWRIAGWLLAVGPIALLLGLGGWAYWAEREGRERELTGRWLEMTIIPVFKVNDVSLSSAVAVLNEHIREVPGHPRGLHIAFANPEDTARRFRRLVLPAPAPHRATSLSALPLDPGALPEEPITIHLTDIPLSEAIRYIVALGGATREIRARQVLIHLTGGVPGTVEPIKAARFRLRSKITPFLGGEATGIHPFLIDQGVQVFEGDRADYDPTSGRLEIRADSDHIDLIEVILGQGREISLLEKARRWMIYRQRQLRESIWPSTRQQLPGPYSPPLQSPDPAAPPNIPGLD